MTYIKKFDYDNAGTEKAILPLPDSSDISQGMQVNFDDIDKELKRIKKDFDGNSGFDIAFFNQIYLAILLK